MNTPCRFCQVPLGEHVSDSDGTLRCADGRIAQPIDVDRPLLPRILTLHEPVDITDPRTRAVAKWCRSCTRERYPCPTRRLVLEATGRPR